MMMKKNIMTKNYLKADGMEMPMIFTEEEDCGQVFYDEDLDEIVIKGEIGEDFFYQFRKVFLPLVRSAINGVDVQDEEGNIEVIYDKEIDIYIDSPGGCLDQAFCAVDLIESAKAQGVKVNMSAATLCGSAALLIYCVGSERKAQPHSTFLFHQLSLSLGSFVKSIEVEELAEQNRESWNEMKRITKMYTKVTDEFMDNVYKSKKDYFFKGKEALELGIVTELY